MPPPTKINGMVPILAHCARVICRVACRGATCASSCAMTPASSASSSAARIKPEFTEKNPPGSAKALMSSASMTLMVKGTCASELRTRFCPIRFTYSVTTGSWISFTLASTCWAYSLPMRISLSSEYQLPMPRPPILRLPMASTSFLPPSCLILLSSFCGITGGVVTWSVWAAPEAAFLSWEVVPWSCATAHGVTQNISAAAIANRRRVIKHSLIRPFGRYPIITPLPRGIFLGSYKSLDAESGCQVTRYYCRAATCALSGVGFSPLNRIKPSFRHDFELHPNLILDLDRAATDGNRGDAEGRLLQYGHSPIAPTLALDLDPHWTRLAVQGEIPIDDEFARAELLHLGRTKTDIGELLGVEHFRT